MLFVVAGSCSSWSEWWTYEGISGKICPVQPFDAHCSRMGTATKHPVPDRVKPSFVIFDIRALWRSEPGLAGTRCFTSVPIWQQWASKG